MNDPIIILLDNNKKLKFFSIEGEKIDIDIGNLKKSDRTIYLILPDELFFFFQTQIKTRKKAYKIVEAYAKSIFPLNNEFVGYLKGILPLIGYIYFDDKFPEEYKYILEKSDIVTTPFVVYMAVNLNNNFVYKNSKICAIYLEKELKYYVLNGNCKDYTSVTDLSENVKELKYAEEEIIKIFIELIQTKKLGKCHIALSEESKIGIENWNFYRFALLILSIFFFVGGDIFRYYHYKSKLEFVNNKIQLIYKKALGNKNYYDPFGMLLYKAQYAGVSYDINPLKLLYAISKAKAHNKIKIDYISFDSNNGVKIMGKADNYNDLVKYANSLSDITSKNFAIQNTFFKNGSLSFTLNYTNSGE